MMFASKTPRDLNHDRYPWQCLQRPVHGCPKSNAVQSSHYSQYSPRREYDHVQHNAPNPILVSFREGAVRANLLPWMDSNGMPDPVMTRVRLGATPEHVQHARRVLTRLANFTKEQA